MNSGTPELSVGQAQLAVSKMKHPRVTEEGMKARIKNVDYVWLGQLTICVITMVNGFMVHGVSAPASPDNFDAQVGKTYAYENAFKQLWPLEGYLLREKLHQSAL